VNLLYVFLQFLSILIIALTMHASGLGGLTEQYWIALSCVTLSYLIGILEGRERRK